MYRNLLLLMAGISYAIVFIFCIILLYRLLDYGRDAAYKRRAKPWESLFFFYLSDLVSVEEAVEGFGRHYKQMWTFLVPYLKSIRGEDREKIRELIALSGLSAYYLQRLRRGSLKEKLKAATVSGAIGNKEALPYIEELLYSKDNEVAAVAAQALTELGEESLLIPVIKRILSRTYTTFEGITGLTIRFGQEVCPYIVEMIERWQKGELDLQEVFSVPYYQSLSLLLDILGHHQYIEGSTIYQSLLQEEEHPEVLIHLFKTLVKLAYPLSINLRPFLHHQDWVVGSQAARYVGSIGGREYLGDLLQLLEGGNWWGRFHAGEAILALGERKLLEELAASEKPGAAMSTYILAKERRTVSKGSTEGVVNRKEKKGQEEEISRGVEDLVSPVKRREPFDTIDISQELEELENSLSLCLYLLQNFQKLEHRLSLLKIKMVEFQEVMEVLSHLFKKESEKSSGPPLLKSLDQLFLEGEEELFGLTKTAVLFQEREDGSLKELWNSICILEDLLLDLALLTFNAIILSAHLRDGSEAIYVISHHMKETSHSLEKELLCLNPLLRRLLPDYSIEGDTQALTERVKDLEGLRESLFSTPGISSKKYLLLTDTQKRLDEGRDVFLEIPLGVDLLIPRLEKALALVSFMKEKGQELLSFEHTGSLKAKLLFIERSLTLIEDFTEEVQESIPSLKGISSILEDLFSIQEGLQDFTSVDEQIVIDLLGEFLLHLEAEDLWQKTPSPSTINTIMVRLQDQFLLIERRIRHLGMVSLQAKIELVRFGGHIFSSQIQEIVAALQVQIDVCQEKFQTVKKEINHPNTFYGFDSKRVSSPRAWLSLRTSIKQVLHSFAAFQSIAAFLPQELQQISLEVKKIEEKKAQLLQKDLSSFFLSVKETCKLLQVRVADLEEPLEAGEGEDLIAIFAAFEQDLFGGLQMEGEVDRE